MALIDSDPGSILRAIGTLGNEPDARLVDMA